LTANNPFLVNRNPHKPLTFSPAKRLMAGNMSSIINLSVHQLRHAADLKEKIAALDKELNQVFGSPPAPAVTAAPTKKRGMSASARAKISAAAKARWASVKAGKPAANSPKPVVAAPAKKRKMSAAAKAKISAAAKARWAKIKAAKK
jgi:hypothetical protein